MSGIKWEKVGSDTWIAKMGGLTLAVERWRVHYSRSKRNKFGFGSYRDRRTDTYAKGSVIHPDGRRFNVDACCSVAEAKANTAVAAAMLGRDAMVRACIDIIDGNIPVSVACQSAREALRHSGINA